MRAPGSSFASLCALSKHELLACYVKWHCQAGKSFSAAWSPIQKVQTARRYLMYSYFWCPASPPKRYILALCRWCHPSVAGYVQFSPASAGNALYKERYQKLEQLPQGCDKLVLVQLKQWGLCSIHMPLALPPTSAAHQGCEWQRQHLLPQWCLDQAFWSFLLLLCIITVVVALDGFPVSCSRSGPATK